ncbi:MAG: HEWD family protein [Halobacteriaceae archaeon]
MSVEIRTPEERECVRCGRAETWDETTENWVVADDQVGDLYCIHDWDITGKFTPVSR